MFKFLVVNPKYLVVILCGVLACSPSSDDAGDDGDCREISRICADGFLCLQNPGGGYECLANEGLRDGGDPRDAGDERDGQDGRDPRPGPGGQDGADPQDDQDPRDGQDGQGEQGEQGEAGEEDEQDPAEDGGVGNASEDASPDEDDPAEGVDDVVETVTDHQTDLMWMKCSVGLIYVEDSNECHGSNVEHEYRFCTQNDNSCNGGVSGGILDSGPLYDVCDQLELDGHVDWRVPTKDELKTLIRCREGPETPLPDHVECFNDGMSGAYIDQALFPATLVGGYWTSSSIASTDVNSECGVELPCYDAVTDAWNINFGNGSALGPREGRLTKDYPRYVRCVRPAGPSP